MEGIKRDLCEKCFLQWNQGLLVTFGARQQGGHDRVF
jgi:hypothetical protein